MTSWGDGTVWLELRRLPRPVAPRPGEEMKGNDTAAGGRGAAARSDGVGQRGVWLPLSESLLLQKELRQRF